jgi:alpha-D-ribose 1-methylphosphonate 5-triphosphate synthase subunit PhnH
VTLRVGGGGCTGGTGVAETIRLTGFDVPPPGAELTAMMASVPGVLRSAAVSVRLSLVELTKPVWRALPFTCSTDVGTKPVPVTAIVGGKVLSMVEGVRLIMTGAGFVTVMSLPLDVPEATVPLSTWTCN